MIDSSKKFDNMIIRYYENVVNDLFSYAIKPQYADQHMDSRLCPEITNVILNVAKVINVLGMGELANPMKAHNGYHTDERVLGLITKGLGQGEDDKAMHLARNG